MNQTTNQPEPRLSWVESGSGHFDPAQLEALSQSLLTPSRLVQELLEGKDGLKVLYAMTELRRHGESGVLIVLLNNNELTQMWELENVSSDDFSKITELAAFRHEYHREISFQRKKE